MQLVRQDVPPHQVFLQHQPLLQRGMQVQRLEKTQEASEAHDLQLISNKSQRFSLLLIFFISRSHCFGKEIVERKEAYEDDTRKHLIRKERRNEKRKKNRAAQG